MHSALHTSLSARSSERVDIYSGDDMTHWCEKLRCTKTQLRDAVTAVGTSADALREYLRKANDNARSGALAEYSAKIS